MPAPAAAAAITLAAIVSAAAVGLAFTKFVYEPHIAPKLEQWAEEFLASREARRRQHAGAVPVLATPHRTDSSSKRSDSDNDGDEERQSIELENLIAKEVREWRSGVNHSQTLRRRVRPGSLGSQYPGESSQTVLMSPTHVLVDSSTPSTPSSTLRSFEAFLPSQFPSLREASSHTNPRSPPAGPSQASGLLPTLSPSASLSHTTPQRPPLSPGMIPSLSQSFPLELDQEHGIELLSAPSSRSDSPFSTFSQPLSPSIQSNLSSANYYSFSSPNALSPDNVMSPSARPPSRGLSDLDLLSDLSNDHDAFSPHWSDAAMLYQEGRNFDDGSSDSSWTSAGARSH